MFIYEDSLPERARRKALRLADHDYAAPGPYFVTICTQKKECVLASVEGGRVRLTPTGRVAQGAWLALPSRYPSLVLHEFVTMPNHIHGLLAFVGAGLAPPGVSTSAESAARHCGRPTLPDIICAFKSISTRSVNELLRAGGKLLWQRGYYEHIVRDAEDMKNVQRYILENPWKWKLDSEYPGASVTGRPLNVRVPDS
jgi:putative transposase